MTVKETPSFSAFSVSSETGERIGFQYKREGLVLVLLASRGRPGPAGSGLTAVFLQGQEHWEEVFAVLEGGVLSLFKDRAAAQQVLHNTPGLSWMFQKLCCTCRLQGAVLCFHRGSPGGPPSRQEEPFVRRTFATGGRRTRSD